VLEFLIRRVAISVVTLFVISLIVFTGVRMIPGDPARVMGGTDADAAGLAEIRQKYGLDDPIPLQYLRWIGHLRDEADPGFVWRAFSECTEGYGHAYLSTGECLQACAWPTDHVAWNSLIK